MNDASALVISAFEAEMQPLAAACAAAALRDQGLGVSAWDAHVFPDPQPEDTAELALLSVQQFEGLDRGLALVQRVRSAGFARKLVAFGQYAQMNASTFAPFVDAVLFDEPERLAAELAGYARGQLRASDLPGAFAGGRLVPPLPRRRMTWTRPARDLFPDLVHYPAHHTAFGLMGNLEATRGCHHKCTYCSVYGAYDGRVAPVEAQAVAADARELAASGVRHFAFIDAEFFNSRRLGIQVMEQVTAEVGPCTFEITTRVDHILHYTAELQRLVGLGLRRVTSALEFPSDRILRIFDKGIDVADMRTAIAEADRLGFELNPTFIPFTPWVGYDELLSFEDFLIETRLSRVVEPTALQTRLLLFKGSPLLASPWIDGIETVDRGFYLEWTHPDPRVERLWSQRREEATQAGQARCCVKC